jgi:tyrosyl-tRNA synthetase
MAIDTNAQKIEELLSLSVENIYPNVDALRTELKSGKQLVFYSGYDPTAPTLHIGHGITMLKLRQLQDLGHKVIMLIGDFTGMIGDPTDKSAARQKLTREQVLENCKEYKKQAERILNFGGENPVEVKFNSEWLKKMSFEEVIELSSHFTVQRMLERDMFEKRMKEEKPIYLHEFLYPLMQGYDSVAMDVDGEVGGNDQTFNMLAGRTLMKEIKHKEKFVIATKLLADETGKKMSKTEGNMIALSDTPEDMFGKVMRWSDAMIEPGFELCTKISNEELEKIREEKKSGANPRDLKLRLAYEITKVFLGEDAAEKGKANFASVIQSKEKPTEIPELKPSAYDIISILVESKIAKSKSDARKLVEQGGVKINDEKVLAIDATAKAGDVVQKGSRFFVKVI